MTASPALMTSGRRCLASAPVEFKRASSRQATRWCIGCISRCCGSCPTRGSGAKYHAKYLLVRPFCDFCPGTRNFDGRVANPVRRENNLIETATMRLSGRSTLGIGDRDRRESDREVEGHAARVHAFGALTLRDWPMNSIGAGAGPYARTIQPRGCARLDAAIGTIRRVLESGRAQRVVQGDEFRQRQCRRPAVPAGLRGGPGTTADQARDQPRGPRHPAAENSARSATSA